MKKIHSCIVMRYSDPDDWMDDHLTGGVWNPTDDDSESDDSDDK